MVDFDNNCIWVPLLTKAVGSLLPNAAREKLLAEKPEFVEDALDLVFPCTNREEIIKATLEWIRTMTIAGYHGSRLVDSEVHSPWHTQISTVELSNPTAVWDFLEAVPSRWLMNIETLLTV